MHLSDGVSVENFPQFNLRSRRRVDRLAENGGKRAWREKKCSQNLFFRRAVLPREILRIIINFPRAEIAGQRTVRKWRLVIAFPFSLRRGNATRVLRDWKRINRHTVRCHCRENYVTSLDQCTLYNLVGLCYNFGQKYYYKYTHIKPLIYFF